MKAIKTFLTLALVLSLAIGGVSMMTHATDNGDRVYYSATVMNVKDGRDAIVTLAFDDGYIPTATLVDEMLLNGPDQNMISGLAVGADGAIGTSYNFMPKVANAIYTSAQAGDFKAAMEAQRKLNAVIDTCLGKNLGYWKAVMTTMGFDMGYNIEPAKLWNDDEIADLKDKLTAIGFYDWL